MTIRSYSKRKQSLLELLAEVLLSFLPMMLVIITLQYLGKAEKVFQKPEWAFAAAIFFGQAIVRLMCAIASNHGNLRAGFLALFVVLILLLGLGPSCAIVVLILFANDSGGQAPEAWLQVVQVLLYAVSSVAYILVSVISRELETSRETPDS